MNSVNITGRLTKDIELKATTNGISCCNFSVAVERPGAKDKTDFIDCDAWRTTAEFINRYFHKGDGIEITGMLTTNDYTDKSGVKRKAVKVTCDRIGFPKGRKSDSSVNENVQQSQQANYQQPQSQQEYTAVEDDDDLPF